MSGVVLRCPNCGTTKAGGGECDACHEAHVRYYCTNHTPGRWLDTPACSQCGAQFGDPARPRAAAPPPGAPAAPTPTSAVDLIPERTGAVSWRPGTGGGSWGRRKRSHSSEEAPITRDEGAAVRDAPAARLPELLRTASRIRRTPREAMPSPEVDPFLVGRAVGGCFRAALFTAMLLLLALVAMFVLLGGSLLQIFGFYF